MTRLAQTADLTDIQREILSTVRSFVDKEIVPKAQELEHGDIYPQEIVDGLKALVPAERLNAFVSRPRIRRLLAVSDGQREAQSRR